MMLGQRACTTMDQRWPNIVMLSGDKFTSFLNAVFHQGISLEKHFDAINIIMKYVIAIHELKIKRITYV